MFFCIQFSVASAGGAGAGAAGGDGAAAAVAAADAAAAAPADAAAAAAGRGCTAVWLDIVIAPSQTTDRHIRRVCAGAICCHIQRADLQRRNVHIGKP